jgi:hypothetical protein
MSSLAYSNLVGVIGSRSLPPSWSGRVSSVVSHLLARGCSVASGGALGADLFALQAVIEAGACRGASVFLPGASLAQAPWACQPALSAFQRSGGSLVPGVASPGCDRSTFIAALFARSVTLAKACKGIVAFVIGKANGSWFTCQQAVRLGRSVVVFPVAGQTTLKSLGCGSWQPVASWPGAWRWVPSAPPGVRCKHGILAQHCAGIPASIPYEA